MTIWLAALVALLGAHHAAKPPGELIGHSSQGRPITLQWHGVPASHPDVLVFGCIHGTECAASGIAPPVRSASVAVVPNLNPDGYAAGTRTNARGVDLNRNFPAAWQPFESRGDPQYSGPRPLSEPETRVAARLISRLKPEVTIWFHQQVEPPLVRAWGQSVPAARRYARLAGLPFAAMPWIAGTAPNWQNHRFPGTSSFVVELPWGTPAPSLLLRQEIAIARIAGTSARPAPVLQEEIGSRLGG